MTSSVGSDLQHTAYDGSHIDSKNNTKAMRVFMVVAGDVSKCIVFNKG